MTWIDTTVVVTVVALGLIILYKAVKEPIDMLFRLIGRGFGAIRDRVTGMGGDYYDEIRYG